MVIIINTLTVFFQNEYFLLHGKTFSHVIESDEKLKRDVQENINFALNDIEKNDTEARGI